MGQCLVLTRGPRILTANCHEAYVHLLAELGPTDIVDGLPGRYASTWDTTTRPVPPTGRLIAAAQIAEAKYDVVIAHSITDLMLFKAIESPKILILHVSLHARHAEESGSAPVPAMQAQLAEYLALTKTSVVAVSEMKRASWGVACKVIRPAADLDVYGGFRGDMPMALRVANHVEARRQRFAWDDHERIVQGLPCQLLGHNPEFEQSRPSRSWEDLQEQYRAHRAYVHTARVGLDDGYNLAVVEAMATAMPVVTTGGSDNPIVDAENGYQSTDLEYLHQRLEELLRSPEQARTLGARARETVAAHFSLGAFKENWLVAIAEARSYWK